MEEYPLWDSINALSFYGSKIILDRPNNFCRVPTNHFGCVPICFGQVQIIKISPENLNLNPTKMIWTRSKQIVFVQNHSGPIEGQGIRIWCIPIDFMSNFSMITIILLYVLGNTFIRIFSWNRNCCLIKIAIPTS